MEESHEETAYQITVGIDDVRVLLYATEEAIKNWPGAPARPYQEQEHLWATRDWLKKIIFEHTFHNM